MTKAPPPKGLSDIAKMLLARAGGRIIPRGRVMMPPHRDAIWVDINKLAEATADMNWWVSNRLGDGDPMKGKPVYAWHRGRNGAPLCGAEMESNPLEKRNPMTEHRCTECTRIWRNLHWFTEGEADHG